MNKIVLTLCSTLFLLTILVSCSPEENFSNATLVSQSFGIYSQVGKQKYHATITSENFKENLSWEIGQSLPLSIAEASAIATAEIENYYSEKELWLISGIEIERFGTSNNWFYIVKLFKKSASNMEMTTNDYLSIPVLFDGTTIKGKKE